MPSAAPAGLRPRQFPLGRRACLLPCAAAAPGQDARRRAAAGAARPPAPPTRRARSPPAARAPAEAAGPAHERVGPGERAGGTKRAGIDAVSGQVPLGGSREVRVAPDQTGSPEHRIRRDRVERAAARRDPGIEHQAALYERSAAVPRNVDAVSGASPLDGPRGRVARVHQRQRRHRLAGGISEQGREPVRRSLRLRGLRSHREDQRAGHGHDAARPPTLRRDLRSEAAEGAAGVGGDVDLPAAARVQGAVGPHCQRLHRIVARTRTRAPATAKMPRPPNRTASSAGALEKAQVAPPSTEDKTPRSGCETVARIAPGPANTREMVPSSSTEWKKSRVFSYRTGIAPGSAGSGSTRELAHARQSASASAACFTRRAARWPGPPCRRGWSTPRSHPR